MREEETQISRLLSIQVCDIPLSLIPFSDIEEVKKYTRFVLFFFLITFIWLQNV